MLENQNIRPRTVIGPLGEPLTLEALPPQDTERWVIRRKAEVVASVTGGLLTFDKLGWAMTPPLVYILLHATESQFVTPALLGKRFDVNPLIVFLAIVLGTWMWGAIGAFLAAPLLVIAMNAWTRIVEQDRPYLPE